VDRGPVDQTEPEAGVALRARLDLPLAIFNSSTNTRNFGLPIALGNGLRRSFRAALRQYRQTSMVFLSQD
jgi:hypothetical protein